ncbi:MAG: HAMP domain-containing protein [Candidatus Omnitrophota bacterium]
MQNRIHVRRRIHMVKMEFQRNFILKFCAIIIFSSLIIGVIVYVLSAASMTTAFESSRLVIKSTSDFILPFLIISCLAGIIMSGTLTIIITLFISHRIAGPIYRLEQDIAEIDKGNLNLEIHVRANDELQDLAKSLNQMVKTIRTSIIELDKELSTVPAEALSDNDRQRLENAKSLLKKFKY